MEGAGCGWKIADSVCGIARAARDSTDGIRGISWDGCEPDVGVSTRRKWVLASVRRREGTFRKGPTLLDQFAQAGPPCGRRGSQHDDPPAPAAVPMYVIWHRDSDEGTQVERWRGRHPKPTFMGRAPEFVSLAAHTLEPGRRGVVVHPDPPLGDEESALLGAAWGDLRLMSMSQWLAEVQ